VIEERRNGRWVPALDDCGMPLRERWSATVAWSEAFGIPVRVVDGGVVTRRYWPVTYPWSPPMTYESVMRWAREGAAMADGCPRCGL
jgi:hypothetical protein